MENHPDKGYSSGIIAADGAIDVMNPSIGNMSEGMNPYSYMQSTIVPGLVALPTHISGSSKYGYMSGSNGLPTHDVYSIMQQQQQNLSGYPPDMYMDDTNAPWMSMMPLNVSMNGNDDHNNSITIDESSITIINNSAEEGRVN